MFSVGSSGEWSEQFVNKFDDIEISACDTKEGDVGCSARVGGKRKTQNIDTVLSVSENGEKKVGNCEVVAIGQNAKSNRVKSCSTTITLFPIFAKFCITLATPIL